jgi:hypothetical protein
VSPGGHLITTALAAGTVYAGTGSPALAGGIAAGGILIDVDHVLDYLLVDRRRDLSPSAFLRYYVQVRPQRFVLALHSYELMALLGLLAWITDWVPLWGWVLGALLHLPLDILFNGQALARNLVSFYSFVHRWRAGFRSAALLGAVVPPPRPAGFWRAFFAEWTPPVPAPGAGISPQPVRDRSGRAAPVGAPGRHPAAA